MLKNGYWNSIIGNKVCKVTTDNFGYIVIEDDVWFFTGVTSVSSDESNIGFIISNARTGEYKFYPVIGAEEYSAMDSAQGAVQQYSYTATFPILLNIAGEPTYFISLKDDSNLVKMYAMVNVRQYQIVTTATSVKQCEDNYYELLVENGVIKDDVTPPDSETTLDHTGLITEIRSAVIGGNTYYYFKVEGSDKFFKVGASGNELAVILNVGDKVKITWVKTEDGGDITQASKIERAS